MSKNSLLTRSNIRKAKGQTVAITILVLLASIMMNLWLALGIDYKANFDRTHDRLNDSHITLILPDADEIVNFIKDKLDNSSDVSEYCVTPTYQTLFNKDDALSREVGKFEIVEEGNYKSGIYLPIIDKGDADYQYQIGDDYQTDNGDKFTVCGFFNSTMMGSQNCGIIGYMATDDVFHKLYDTDDEQTALFTHNVCVSVRLNDKSQSKRVRMEIRTALKEHIDELGWSVSYASNTYEMVTTTRYISQSICAAVICAMAFIIILIAAVVISSNVGNFISQNMQNLGALKAIGYKSSQLIGAQTAQFSLVALISSICGVGLSYTIFPYIVDMMNQQTGIPYDVRFLPIPCVITIAAVVGAVALSVFLSARGIKKIEPITALRQGIATHNFKKNHVPLDKAKSPINLALALKTTLSGAKRNITVCVTMLVLSLVIVFAGMMYKNVIADVTPIRNMVIGEVTDYGVNVNSNIKDSFLEDMKNDNRVEKIYRYTFYNITHEGGAELEGHCSDDFGQINNQNLVVEGRFPKYANEVAIGISYARDMGLKIGDEITLSSNKKGKFIITGFTQYSNALGMDCLLTEEGCESLVEEYEGVKIPFYDYYMNIKSGVDIDAFDKELKDKYGDKIVYSDNMQRVIDNDLSVYTSLVAVIVVAVIVLSALIVLFVLYLLVRMMLNNKKRDYGILKALGYTTGQLVVQTAFSLMPPIAVSAAVGITISSLVIKPLTSVFLAGIAVVKCPFEISILFNIIAGIALILFAFGTACLMSLRIKKIVPRELLSGE